MQETRIAPILVTFASTDGDPYPRDKRSGQYVAEVHDASLSWGPTLRTVADPHSPFFRRVRSIYYLCHPAKSGGRERGRAAVEVAEDLEDALVQHLGANAPKLHVVTLQAKRSPVDHAELFELICNYLRAVRAKNPGVELVLQIGVGTPAMHAVSLLAGSIGVIDGPLRLIQAERGEGVRLRPNQPVTDVNLSVATILQLARTSTASTKGGDEALSISFDRAKSASLRRALSEAQRAASLPFPILLRGERGVGKSTIAQVIRAASPYRRASQDSCWPSVACGQFTDAERLNSELCGSVKGAYTGSVNRWGLLKSADGDTLFLDEIQDLDARSQRVLIRVIEDGVYYRLGEDKPQRSKFRLICGTNQPDTVLLERLAADFYDRIRDIEIEIPPLRDCREDVPWMWDDAWARVARQCGLRTAQLDATTRSRLLKVLDRHPLPGNRRDLRRLAVRLASALADSTSSRDRLPEEVLEDFARESTARSASNTVAEPVFRTKRDLTQFTRLEAQLGPGFDRFWEKCPPLPTGHVLKELLGDRYRAERAMEFIRRTYPKRCAQLIVLPETK